MSAKSSLTKNANGASRIEVVHCRDSVAGDRSRLADVVYDNLKEAIFEFRMAPGDRFSEQELASRFGVSRTPMRFALHVLARDGFVNRIGGHACWQVKPIDLDYFEELYDFRTEIELVAVRRLCAMDPVPDLNALADFWCVPRDERETSGRAVATQDEILHSTLVELAGNREMLRTHRELTELIRIIRRLDFIDLSRVESAFEEHAQILDAIVNRRTELAESLLKTHIDGSRAEIRQITLHKIQEARQSAAQPICD